MSVEQKTKNVADSATRKINTLESELRVHDKASAVLAWKSLDESFDSAGGDIREAEYAQGRTMYFASQGLIVLADNAKKDWHDSLGKDAGKGRDAESYTRYYSEKGLDAGTAHEMVNDYIGTRILVEGDDDGPIVDSPRDVTKSWTKWVARMHRSKKSWTSFVPELRELFEGDDKVTAETLHTLQASMTGKSKGKKTTLSNPYKDAATKRIVGFTDWIENGGSDKAVLDDETLASLNAGKLAALQNAVNSLVTTASELRTAKAAKAEKAETEAEKTGTEG